jgi:hypothetical protein
MPLYTDWDQFEKPSKIKVYLNNGETLEISSLKLKGGKKVYDAILQAFIDDRFDITDKVIQGMTNNLSEVKSFTLDSESASDSDKITDFLTKNDVSFKKEGSKIKISLDRNTPKASSILGKLKSLAKFDELNEAKGTLCGRCGHVHVKGTPCPRPFIKEGAKPDFLDIDKDGNKTEPMKKAVKDSKKNLKEGLKDFTDLQLQDLKMQYHSQVNAEKDPKKKEYLKQDLNDIEAELSNRKSKKINEGRENDIVASMDPNHPLATKDVEQWNDEDMKEYKKLWDKKHGNDTVKDMLKKAVISKIKEADVDPTAGSVVVSKMTPPAEIKKYTAQGIDVQLKELYDFFEDTLDDDNYVDVSGQSVEMTMEELLMEFEERLKEIPEESREAGLRAIKTFWINMIKDWNPDLTTPHRAPITEAKHPIFEVKEYDYEGQMARTQLISIVKNAKSLFDSIGDKTQLQAWVQSKLTKAEDYLNAVRSYLEGESISNTAPLMVNNEPARDDEGTALNIGDVVRAANGGIYQAVHSYSEGKPFLTPFDLKKRKPTNLRERHYFDNISEDGMSITKKMYKVMSHNQTKGGFTK